MLQMKNKFLLIMAMLASVGLQAADDVKAMCDFALDVAEFQAPPRSEQASFVVAVKKEVDAAKDATTEKPYQGKYLGKYTLDTKSVDCYAVPAKRVVGNLLPNAFFVLAEEKVQGGDKSKLYGVAMLPCYQEPRTKSIEDIDTDGEEPESSVIPSSLAWIATSKFLSTEQEESIRKVVKELHRHHMAWKALKVGGVLGLGAGVLWLLRKAYQHFFCKKAAAASSCGKSGMGCSVANRAPVQTRAQRSR